MTARGNVLQCTKRFLSIHWLKVLRPDYVRNVIWFQVCPKWVRSVSTTSQRGYSRSVCSPPTPGHQPLHRCTTRLIPLVKKKRWYNSWPRAHDSEGTALPLRQSYAAFRPVAGIVHRWVGIVITLLIKFTYNFNSPHQICYSIVTSVNISKDLSQYYYCCCLLLWWFRWSANIIWPHPFDCALHFVFVCPVLLL